MTIKTPNSHRVLAAATINACSCLGISHADIPIILGCELQDIENGIDPNSVHGERAKALVNINKSLLTLFGRDKGLVRQWFNTFNNHLHSAPCSLVRTEKGARTIIEYLRVFQNQHTNL